ncbi:MAG: S41 family peptidase [Candidatus Sericytochromatia bacterium]
MQQGYYRFPTVADDTIVFTCEDDLWAASLDGGVPRRLTAGGGEATHGALSPDGQWLAFTGREEGGTEVYVMPAAGGPFRRLTFLGATALVVGWTPDGASILFASNARQAFARETALFKVGREGGEPEMLPYGPARHIGFGPGGRMVLGRNTMDPARWKRYRGGTAGELWIDRAGDGQFDRLKLDVGNPTTPMWIGGRIYFIADFEGYGNLYSCTPEGEDLKRHTDHDRYYARQARTDGKRIVYHAGADLYVYDPATDDNRLVPITWQAPSPQLARKFIDAGRYVDGIDLHPEGHSLAVATRGKPLVMGNWAGTVTQLGEAQGVRYREPVWLMGGKRFVAVTDAPGEETLVVFEADGLTPGTLLEGIDLGRVIEIKASPKAEVVAVANHRHELFLVDVAAGAARLVDRSPNGRLAGLAWSPDGAWLAYGFPNTPKTTCLKLVEAASGDVHQVTEPVLHDFAPSWDPKGDYLYFLSHRVFDPVYDNLHFDLGFPKGCRPCLVTLRQDVPSPFVPRVEEPKPEAPAAGEEKKDETPQPIRIDLEGIARRLVAFPVPEARYWQVLGLAGKVIFSSVQPKGALGDDIFSRETPAEATLEVYDFATQKRETLAEAMTHVQLSLDGKHMLLRVGDRFRVLPAGEKPKPDAPQEAGRESGWIDLGRIRVSIEPRAEWRQMYREAWRLQRDQFWTEDMSKVDWQRVHDAYLPLLDRLSSRAELSDLLWEMQGELGTSHAYEYGGDYRPNPRYDQGHLGATFAWDPAAEGYRVTSLIDGDPGQPGQDSPLRRVGVDVREGDVLLAINGRRLTEVFSPGAALVHQARVEVQLTFAGRDGGSPRQVQVRSLSDEWSARYREWVEGNRRRVHAASGGQLGYVHIPDMGPLGYAEFHRGYLAESQRDGLVVDVRYNGGGHVSQLILEKLARQRLGYDIERWGAVKPYPDDSVAGPMVCLTNEHAGSDGDIFSHCFKLMKLGPLLGKRTWGGVIGIWPRHGLVDGTLTTQPEFSFWFNDVGWGVENYGAEPDVEVDNKPQDYVSGHDAQLEKAIATALDLLATNPPAKPDFSDRPMLAPPRLPARK